MRRKAPDDQLSLFAPPSPEAPGAGVAGAEETPKAAPLGRRVRAAPPAAEIAELGRRLPAGVFLGGSTWSFPGWEGLVYAEHYSQSQLAREGLEAYARHPLLRAVGIDRTHYRPLPAADLARYAAAVPDGFRFLVKAHEACTLARYPDRPRYGAERGRINPRFLAAGYAADEVVAPYVEGLGTKGGALLFEFAPQDLGVPARFAAELHAFLAALPRGPVYAVELRNRDLLVPDYAAALAAAGACPCLNVHPRMPGVGIQARLAGAAKAPMTVVRWLLARDMTYEAAGRLYAPFNRIAAPDAAARRDLAELARQALASGRSFLATVNNNAEGSSPLSIAALAREIVGD